MFFPDQAVWDAKVDESYRAVLEGRLYRSEIQLAAQGRRARVVRRVRPVGRCGQAGAGRGRRLRRHHGAQARRGGAARERGAPGARGAGGAKRAVGLGHRQQHDVLFAPLQGDPRLSGRCGLPDPAVLLRSPAPGGPRAGDGRHGPVRRRRRAVRLRVPPAPRRRHATCGCTDAGARCATRAEPRRDSRARSSTSPTARRSRSGCARARATSGTSSRPPTTWCGRSIATAAGPTSSPRATRQIFGCEPEDMLDRAARRLAARVRSGAHDGDARARA